MPLTDKHRVTLEAEGMDIAEMELSAANDNACDARGGATGWRSRRAAAVGLGVGRRAEDSIAGWAVTSAAVVLTILVLALDQVTLN